MSRPTILEHLSARIGQTYTVEDHAAVVAHLAAVERLAQDVSALREREHRDILSREARGLLVEMIPSYHRRSLIDPEVEEI